MIPFTEWLPDLPDYKNPGLTEAKNVIPASNSYRSLSGLNAYSDALSAAVIGATSAVDADGNTSVFAGTLTGLYKLNPDTTWEDVSIVGGYSTDAAGQWNFAQWGEQVIATNFDDAIQEYTLGTSTDFAVLAASAPQSRYITVIGDFVVVANTYDATDGNQPQRVRWCAIGDPTDWTVSATTQADFQDLDASKGLIMGIVGGEYGVVFQEHAISRMVYEGSPTIFHFNEVEDNRGAMVAGSIVRVGHKIFYLGWDGFYMFNRTESIPIGAEKINKTFLSDLDQGYMQNIRASIDPINNLVLWSYPSGAATNGIPNKIVIYNWVTNKWSWAEVTTEIIFPALSLGYTLDGLDSVSTDLDALPFSLDSRAWMGGAVLLAAFDSSHILNYFNGTTLDGTIETGEDYVFEGSKALINRLRGNIDGTYTVQVGARNTLNASVSWSGAVSPVTSGDCPTRSNARYHRFRINTSGDFEHAQGVELVETHKTGNR